MLPKPFYSRTDADLATGAENLISIVTPVPATFGLTSALVTSYTALSTSYSSLLALATAPATRTSVSIENKNQGRKLLRAASVNIAKIITATPTVTNAQLLSLELNQRLIPTPRPVPSNPPAVEVVSVSGRLVNIRLRDVTSERRGLPFGARGANIFSYVGPDAPTDPRAYHFEGMTTRAAAQIIFPDSVASGATVWLSACWVSARGQRSVGSTPISFTLQGGAIPAAA